MTYNFNLGRAFESVVSLHPERSALRFANGQSYSYQELDTLANQIAAGLIDRGIRRHDVLGVFNSKKAEGYATMLAALKLGVAYVNLDRENPPQRLQRILETCKPWGVLTDGELPEDLIDALPVRVIAIKELQGNGSAALPSIPKRIDSVIGNDIAYIMFTSGSTGVPKGVAITHASVLNLVGWSRAQFQITADDILTNVNPMYFDNSVFDFYAALMNGATLAVFERELVAQPNKLVEAVGRLGCTLWFSVPSMLIYLTTLKQIKPSSWPHMRRVAFGGEGYPVGELRKLRAALGAQPQLFNVYGPTECTCICSAHLLGENELSIAEGLPPLGKLAPNFDYLILNDGDCPVSRGEVGELCLLGPQVAAGYFNDQERTSKSFVQNPLHSSYVDRMYRCGDLVREDAEGLLWFVGRKDNQIKHMGYRIELEEVEAALLTLEGVSEAVALYERVREQHGRIVAYVAGGISLSDSQAMRLQLRERLPEYMVPAVISTLAVLPKNANGKVDRKALSAARTA